MAGRSRRFIQAEFSGAFFIASFDNKAISPNAGCLSGFATLYRELTTPIRRHLSRHRKGKSALEY
jgi:hypothetical protein